MPQSATDILLAQGNLSAEQLAYLEKYTVTVDASTPAVEPVVETTPVPAESSSATSKEYTIKGKTIFGDLISWGVHKATIEQIIGATMPDPAMKVKDYATANGLDFETLKTTLQAEVNKVEP